MSQVERLLQMARKVPIRLASSAYRISARARRAGWDTLKDRRLLAELARGELCRTQQAWQAPDELMVLPGVALPAQTPCANEYLYRVRDAYVEPEWGYAIMPPGTLLDESLPFSEMTRDWSRMHLFSGLPSLRTLRAVAQGRLEPRRLGRALSLRHPFDLNYYHFTVDVMPRLELMSRAGLPEDVTLLVSPALWQQPFFQAAIARPGLAKGQWLMHTEYLQVSELFIAKPLDGGTAAGLAHYRQLLGAPEPPEQGELKIFLDRAARRGRSLANRSELLPVIERAGFRLVDADQLSLLEQAELFSRCSMLAGLHGAGLSNMFFRGGQRLEVREIFPPGETSLEYAILAQRLGYGYRHARGTRAEGSHRNASFGIDPATLAGLLSAE